MAQANVNAMQAAHTHIAHGVESSTSYKTPSPSSSARCPSESPFETLKKLNAERDSLGALWLTANACLPKEIFTINHLNALPPLPGMLKRSNAEPSPQSSLAMQAFAPETLVQLHMRQCFAQQQQQASVNLFGMKGLAGLNIAAAADAMRCSQQMLLPLPMSPQQTDAQQPSALSSIDAATHPQASRAVEALHARIHAATAIRLPHNMQFTPVAPAPATISESSLSSMPA